MNRRNLLLLFVCSVAARCAHAGAWGSGAFDNDDAMDWVGECARSGGVKFVASTLDKALKSGYIESPDCSEAIAAAEVVAAALGKPNEKLPKELVTWVSKQAKEELTELSPQAIKAVLRVLNGPQSELLDLWKESKSFPEWQGKMNNLLNRLK